MKRNTQSFRSTAGQCCLLLGSTLFLFCCTGPTWEDSVGADANGYPPDSEENVESPAVFLTVATYNVEDFDLGQEGPTQYTNVARFARGSEIDLLVLQELQNDDSGHDEYSFITALKNAEYPMDYWGFSSMSDGYNAIAVWSRYPLGDFLEILPQNTRTVYRFRAIVADQSIWFYGCHLKSGTDTVSQATRETEAQLLETRILQDHDVLTESVVILGDMNTMSDGDWLDDGTIGYLTLKSDNPNNTANDFFAVNHEYLPQFWTNPGWKSLLDHIILSPKAMEHYIDDSVQVPNPPGDGEFGPSDHYPVLLELGVRKK